MKVISCLLVILFGFNLTVKSQLKKEINKIEIISIPQRILVRSGIYTEEKFDTLFADLKSYKTIPGNKLISDSLQRLGQKISKLDRIDIRAKLTIFFKDGTTNTLFIDSNGLTRFKNKVYMRNNYIMTLLEFD